MKAAEAREQLATVLAEYAKDEVRKSDLFDERERLRAEERELQAKLSDVNTDIRIVVRGMVRAEREIENLKKQAQ